MVHGEKFIDIVIRKKKRIRCKCNPQASLLVYPGEEATKDTTYGTFVEEKRKLVYPKYT